jgi:hypothetical protein
MYLDAVKSLENAVVTNGNGPHSTEKVFETWKNWRASEISHHGGLCCETAREWLLGTDYSEMGGVSPLTGPRWLRQKFKWGASSFPIYWCEVVQKTTLDCGALAALACEVFKARGVKAYRVQMVQRFSEVSTAQWGNSWGDGSVLPWTKDDLIYHEGCAIAVEDNDIKIWDSSAGWWINSVSSNGYGALLAVRISGWNVPEDSFFTWGANVLAAHKWIQLKF